jgi:hypothetical protein
MALMLMVVILTTLVRSRGLYGVRKNSVRDDSLLANGVTHCVIDAPMLAATAYDGQWSCSNFLKKGDTSAEPEWVRLLLLHDDRWSGLRARR